GLVFGSMHCIPPEIGADIDEDAPRRASQMIGYPLRQQRLVGPVFSNVTADNIAPTHKEGQLRLFRSGAECRTPWHEPGQQENESSDRTGDTKHALRHLVPATMCDLIACRHIRSVRITY